MAPPKLSGSLCALLVGAALITGCGGDSAAELISKARGHAEKGDFRSASIELKSALQKEPASAEARFLLGKVLLNSGEPDAAEVELRKAQAGSYRPNELVPLLARTMLARGDHKKLLTEFGNLSLADAAAAQDLKTTLATAQAYSGAMDIARTMVAEVLQQAPAFAPALLLQARLDASAGNVDAALEKVRSVVKADPANVEALMLLGGLNVQTQKDLGAAIDAYEKVVALRPDNIEAHSGLVALYLRKKDAAAATKAFERMQGRMPNHPQTRLVAAQMAAERGDLKGAREHVQHLLKLAPQNVRLLQFAGAVELELGSLVQAEALLSKALLLAPDLNATRARLARVYLQSGMPDKALHALRVESESTLADADMLSIAAEAYLHNGDAKTAESYFNRALKLKPEDTKIRAALAVMRLTKGNAQGAYEELQTLSAKGPDTSADMALIAVRLRDNDMAGALKAIESLERKRADAALVANLRGRAYLAGGDLPNARKSFEQSVTSNPLYMPAVTALANLDFKDGKLDAARQRFEAVVKLDPKNGLAMRTIAGLRIKGGAGRDEAVRLMSDAIKADPVDPASRLMLIEYLMGAKEAKAAETAAQEAVATIPNSPELLDAMGRAQLQSGSTQQALVTFNKLAQAQPGSPQPYLRIAEAHLRSGDEGAAGASLRRALEVTPNFLPAQRGLITLAQKAKKPDAALAIAREVKRQRPDEAVGYLLEGDIRFAQKDWDAAIAAFTAGLGKQGAAVLPPRLHSTLVAANRGGEAERFAATWLKDHPKDALFLKHLGDFAMSRLDFATAEQRFQDLSKLDPDNPAILNNVAWLQLQQKKTGALPLAEKAVALAPNNATLLETLAQALVAEKQFPRAIEIGKRALQLQPDNFSLRLSVAKIFADAGDKALANAELDRLAQAARGNAAVQSAIIDLRAKMTR